MINSDITICQRTPMSRDKKKQQNLRTHLWRPMEVLHKCDLRETNENNMGTKLNVNWIKP